MKWLRFGGKNVAYINTGIVPKAGYSIITTIRSDNPTTAGLFGSRTGDGSPDAMDCYLIVNYDNNKLQFQCDYGEKGATIDIDYLPSQQSSQAKKAFSITLAKTSNVNGNEHSSGRTNTDGNYPIYIGTVNTAGSPDGRNGHIDYSDFVILDDKNKEVFHGVPVEQGSTEYSTIAAPSNCMWDTVSGTYKQKSGGDGVLWIDQELIAGVDNSTAPISTTDHGFKVLSGDNDRVFNMNSKYRLFGADITSKTSQFKTYNITLIGDAPEPQYNFPPYVYDNEFYYGSEIIEREVLTINTGLDPTTTKIINFEWDTVKENMIGARGHEYINSSDASNNLNTYVVPNSASISTQYVNNVDTKSIIASGTMDKTYILSIPYLEVVLPTLKFINGDSTTYQYGTMDALNILASLDSGGVLHIYAQSYAMYYQRAYRNEYGFWFETRLYSWAWLTGLSFRVSILNTPYKL